FSLSHSQIKFINLSTIDPQTKEFYIGIENNIEISGINKNNNDELKADISTSRITNLGNNRYSILLWGEEKPVVFTFTQVNKIVLIETFQARIIPDPIVRLSNISDSSASINQIILNPFLTVVFPNCSLKHNLSVIDFTTNLITAAKDTTTFNF